MRAVLISSKQVVEDHEATPIRMKTPTGLHLIGFGSQEVGAYYIRTVGLDQGDYDFIEAEGYFAAAPNKDRKSEQIVFFRREQDVDLHLQDRSRFPYLEYQLTSDDFPGKG